MLKLLVIFFDKVVYYSIRTSSVTRMHSSRMRTARTMTVGGGGLGEIYFILIL